MLSSVKRIITDTKNVILSNLGIRAVIKNTAHFQQRLLQRFNDEDMPKLERAIIKAFEKASPNNKTFRYTHPAYNITVVIKKLGVNGVELITCWKKGDEDAQYA